MRKTSYAITFLLVAVALFLNVFAIQRPDWLIVKGSDIIHTRITVRYGLTERCERTIIEIPGPSAGGKIAYTDYQCRAFPSSVTDRCEKGNRGFCTAWSSAGYLAEMSIIFGAVALLSLIFGVSTHSRRRRIWKAVAVLVTAHAAFIMAAWAIITDLWRTSSFWELQHAQPSFSYYVSLVSWIFSYAIVGGVIYTGVAADKGHRWAAGNRAYRIIEDRE
ncbi:hypothetical protein DENSPDRAFT_841948 [Dentipellis sp. KUC8613]|nr:hypothetical protein DENSPDRAFT_841948 [Dentipellis sp. KUC8613]